MVAALLASFALMHPAAAQDATTLKKDMVGQWELSTTERSKTCVVTLKADAAPQGLKLELEPGCAKALPFAKDIAAWSVKGLDIVRLQDASGQPVIDFTEVESGIFEGVRQNEGVYILQNLAAARSLAKSMDQMIGDWAMVRGNGQCHLRPDADQHRCRSGQFSGVSEAEMRCRHYSLRADAVAVGAWPDAPDVGQGRNLAVRGRRQRAVADGARQPRSADHDATVILTRRPPRRAAGILLRAWINCGAPSCSP